MKEIVIISGKGGTGKTSITAAFATLAQNLVLVDCDVDAADLHIIMTPKVLKTHNFYGGKTASINQNLCQNCGLCFEICRFGAVSYKYNDKDIYVIDPVNCEGCGVCAHFCPHKSIVFDDALSGEWYISETRTGPMVHAKLGVAAENSGKLVTLIRQKARSIAESQRLDFILVDGPPGIGCPVIASLTGSDLVIIVTEPTVSGIHDMERVVKLARHFQVPVSIIINKADINHEKSEEIVNFALLHGMSILGEIMYDPIVTKAQLVNQSVIEYSESDISRAVIKIWERLQEILLKENM